MVATRDASRGGGTHTRAHTNTQHSTTHTHNKTHPTRHTQTRHAPCCRQARPNSVALFVPAEITSYCFYPGADRRYMVANAIFRMVRCMCLHTLCRFVYVCVCMCVCVCCVFVNDFGRGR